MFNFKAHSKSGFSLPIKEADIYTSELAKDLGAILLEAVVYEIRKTQARHRGLKRAAGAPVQIPLDPKFADSMWVKTTPTSIEVGSSWPTFDAVVEGKQPFPMTWLTQQKGVKVVPFPKGPLGTVLLRTAPKTKEDAWVHPGFSKQSFLEDGLKRAMPSMQKRLEEQVRAKLAKIRYL